MKRENLENKKEFYVIIGIIPLIKLNRESCGITQKIQVFINAQSTFKIFLILKCHITSLLRVYPPRIFFQFEQKYPLVVATMVSQSLLQYCVEPRKSIKPYKIHSIHLNYLLFGAIINNNSNCGLIQQFLSLVDSSIHFIIRRRC